MTTDLVRQYRPLTGALIAALVVLGLGAGPASAQATPPARFFGAAYLHGIAAPSGTLIEARIGGVFCGAGFVTAAGTHSVDVVSDGTAAGCGTSGAVVTFTVGGVPAQEIGIFRSGHFIALDLTTGHAFAARVSVERWARYRDEPCANPTGEWCVTRTSIGPAREPSTAYRMLAFQFSGTVVQATDLIIVTPNVPTARVGTTATRGVARVVWERIEPFGSACAGAVPDGGCIESVDVLPPVRSTVWYRVRVFQPNGTVDDPTGFIAASP